MVPICNQCHKSIKGDMRHRMTLYANRIFCDIECVDAYNEDQQRILGSEQPLPNPAFGYVGVYDE